MILASSLLLMIPPAAAQTRISGLVKDKKTGEPLVGVCILGLTQSKVESIAYSEADGHFVLTVPGERLPDELRALLIGYEAMSIPFDEKRKDFVFPLTEKRTQLRPAKVVASAVEQKGDTLIYTAGSFRDGSERSLGEVLEKLPGISVSATGGIQHKGIPINKLYVEGLDLMGSRYGIVTANLSADAIARVEIYGNHQPVLALKDVVESEQSAVNIILKEGLRNTWLFSGDAVLGYPAFPLFEGRSMLSSFSKKRQSLFLLKGNDTGQDILLEMQLQNLENRGAAAIIPGDIDADMNSRLNPGRRYLNLPKGYWYDNLSGLSSFNFLTKTGDYTQLRISAQAAAERYNESTERREEIFFADGSQLSVTESRALKDLRHYFSGTLSVEQNAPKKYILDELSVSGQFRTDDAALLGNRDNYNQHYRLPSVKIENKLRATSRHRGNRATEWSSDLFFYRKNHMAEYSTDIREYVQKLLCNDASVNVLAKQNRRFGSHSLTFTSGCDLNYIQRDADLAGLRFEDVKTEDRLSVFTFRGEASCSDRISIGRSSVTITIPLAFHYLYVDDGESSLYPSFNPRIVLQSKFSQRMELRLSTVYSTRRSEAESLLGAAVMQDWRTLSQSDSLQRSSRWNSQATLSWNDVSSMLFASLTASWSLRGSERSTANVWLEELTYRYSLPSAVLTSGWSTSLSIKKYFGINILNVRLNSGLSGGQVKEYLQASPVNYRNTRWFSSMEIGSHPVRWLSLNLKGQYERVFAHGPATRQNKVYQAEGTILVNPIRALDLHAGVFWLHEKHPGTSVSNTPLIRLSASWKAGKAILFAECRNLLDATTYRRDSVSAYYTVSSVTKLLGRQFLVGIRMTDQSF